MRIGVLGGTFNPIHTGHLILAENAYEALQLDQVLFIPSGISYLKEKETVLPTEARLKMVELATESNPHFFVSRMEIERKGNSYTYVTLEQLRTKQDAELFFIGGADTLFGISGWKEPQRIFDAATIVIAPRDGMQYEKLLEEKKRLIDLYRAKIILLATSDLAISSTDLRERIARGQSVRYYIPDPVLHYISKKGFYRNHAE